MQYFRSRNRSETYPPLADGLLQGRNAQQRQSFIVPINWAPPTLATRDTVAMSQIDKPEGHLVMTFQMNNFPARRAMAPEFSPDLVNGVGRHVRNSDVAKGKRTKTKQ